jgi:hypothetical protein
VTGARAAGDRRGRLAALFAVAALTAVVFFDLLFRGQVLFERDIHALFWGQCASFANAVRGGAWPVWNPWLGFGQPMLANPGAQVLYPPTWLNLLVRPESYYSLYAVGHLLLAGTGMLVLARTLRLSWAASTAAAATWMLSGPLLSAVDLWQHFAGAAWMPWVVAGAERALARPSGGRVLAWAMLQSAQVLTGSLDLVVLTALPQAGLLVGRISWRRPLDPANGRTLAAGAAAASLTVAWTAALWLPALDLLGRTARGEAAEVGRTLWSVRPVGLLQGLLPLFIEDLPLREDVRRLLYEGREPLLASLYLGLPALALALAAATSARRRLAAAAGGLVAVSLLLALGRHGVAYFWATAALPQLGLLRYPAKTTLLAAFGFALLVALGLEAWRKGALPHRAAAGLAGVLGLVSVLALLAVRWLRASADALLTPGPDSPLVPGAAEAALALATWSGGAGLVAAGLLALGARAGPPRRTALVTMVAFLATFDLLVVHRGLNPSAPRAFVQATPPAVEILRADGARRLYAFDYLLRPAGTESLRPEKPAALARIPRAWRHIVLAQVYPTSPPRWSLGGSFDADVVGLDSRPRRGLRLLAIATERDRGPLLRLLRVGGIGHVAALHREGLEVLEPLATAASKAVGDVHVYRVPGRRPPAFVVGGALIADGIEAYKALLDPAFDPGTTALLPSGRPRSAPEGFSGFAEVTEERADRLSVTAVASAPALLVVPQGYDEGWRATVDGHPAPVLRANVAFRGVPIAAGRHEVALAYRPASVPRGLWVSGLSIAAALAALWLRRKRARARPAATETGPAKAPAAATEEEGEAE